MAQIDYGKIIGSSWKNTRKFKWLWVYGFVLAALEGSSHFNSSGGGNHSASTNPANPPAFPTPTNPQQLQKVLGDATSAIIQWVQQIPWYYWLLLAVCIILAILLAIAISWIARSWATAGLITAWSDITKGESPTLASSSPRALGKIKHLISFDLINIGIMFVSILALVVLSVIYILIGVFLKTIGVILAVFAGLATIILFLVVLLYLAILTVYAQRLIVLYNYKPTQAWKRALAIGRKHKLSTILMGLVNTIIGCGVQCLSLIIIGIIIGPFIIAALLSGVFNQLMNNPMSILTMLPLLGSAAITIIVLISSFSLFINGIFIVWKYGNWNELFYEIIKDEENL